MVLNFKTSYGLAAFFQRLLNGLKIPLSGFLTARFLLRLRIWKRRTSQLKKPSAIQSMQTDDFVDRNYVAPNSARGGSNSTHMQSLPFPVSVAGSIETATISVLVELGGDIGLPDGADPVPEEPEPGLSTMHPAHPSSRIASSSHASTSYRPGDLESSMPTSIPWSAGGTMRNRTRPLSPRHNL
ncbi:hypothetical protein FA15DRAFT_81095 [Coprinopsis marcescibilis]|uniref:Uncharacterized protein n=1 Tax=Coprinopsis marcescibilis TaxID=230819 RepID=A0A5C3KM34_COPMA|nr:hypothetical protein FA15DRAFT_81095 [Coprinopsis marcescibilis]